MKQIVCNIITRFVKPAPKLYGCSQLRRHEYLLPAHLTGILEEHTSLLESNFRPGWGFSDYHTHNTNAKDKRALEVLRMAFWRIA